MLGLIFGLFNLAFTARIGCALILFHKARLLPGSKFEVFGWRLTHRRIDHRTWVLRFKQAQLLLVLAALVSLSNGFLIVVLTSELSWLVQLFSGLSGIVVPVLLAWLADRLIYSKHSLENTD